MHDSSQAAQAAQALIDQALRHHSTGDLPAAQALYLRVLAAHPNHPPALHLLGVLKSQTGDRPTGIDLINRAIALSPNVAEFHTNLALVYIENDRPELAVDRARRGLELNPRSLDAMNHLGNALRLLGRPGEAVSHFHQALRIKPDFYDALYNLSLALAQLERYEEAAAAADRAAALRPPGPAQLLHLGRIAQNLGRYEPARAHFSRAIEGLTGAAGAAGTARDAAAGAAILADAYDALGTLHYQAGRLDDALAAYRRALAVEPRHAACQNNLALALAALGRHEEALPHYLASIAARPDSAGALNNLANCYRDLGQYDVARATYGRALVMQADYADAHWNRSLLTLLEGDLRSGWREYEWRWVRFPHERRTFPRPRWDGYDIAGRTILLHYEQGQGDAIQFARYAPLVAAEHGATVYVECQPSLLPLLKNLPGVAGVFARGQPLPPFDVHCPFMSVPLAMDTTLETIPARVPYVAADEARVEQWRARMESATPAANAGSAGSVGRADIVGSVGSVGSAANASSTANAASTANASSTANAASGADAASDADAASAGRAAGAGGGSSSHHERLKVGLAWSGSHTHSRDMERSIPLARLAPLLKVAGTNFFSLQKDPRPADAAVVPTLPLIDLTTHLRDFADTAALVANLDLVICVDTAVAHLAGAMGKPTWLLLPRNPDFRWLLGRDDTPWYPTLRLFRQPALRDWDSVIERVAGELHSRAAGARE
ncbi:MAG TPA: tetratricopeptide repeat protein [Tepidisphaeraceae bacterium]|nr:tetratricopeptide repeat protein [Tepidisphaeraceae bacterium]